MSFRQFLGFSQRNLPNRCRLSANVGSCCYATCIYAITSIIEELRYLKAAKGNLVKRLATALFLLLSFSASFAQAPDYSASIKITWPKDPNCYTGSRRGRPIIANNTLCTENGWRLRGDHIYMLPYWSSCWNHNLDTNTWKDMRDKRYFNCVRPILYQPENFPTQALPLADQIRYLHMIEDLAVRFGFYLIINYHVGCKTTWYDSTKVYNFFKEMTAHFKDSTNVIFQVQSEPLGGDPWPDVYAQEMGSARFKEIDRQLWIWKLLRQWAPDSPIIMWEFMKVMVTGSYDMKTIVDLQPGITYGNSTHTVVGWHAYYNNYDTSRARVLIDAYPSIMTEMSRQPPNVGTGGTGNYGPDIAKLEALGQSWLTLGAFPYYDPHVAIKETVTPQNPVPPPAPTLLAPLDRSVQTATPVRFSWEAASGATSYRLQVATDMAMAHVVVEQTGLTSLNTSAEAPAAGSPYYWRVAASNSAGTGPWSAVRGFSVNADTTAWKNLLINSNFDAGTAGWAFYTNGIGSMHQSSPGFDDNQALNLTITRSGTNIQLFQYNLPLEAGTKYRLSFAAYSSSGHDIEVAMQQHGAPYANYGLKKRVDLTNAWATYALEFTASLPSAVTDARLMFQLGASATSGDQYFLDKVILIRASNLDPIVEPPLITLHPLTQTVTMGQSVTFSVIASGTLPLAFQWQRNRVDLAGAMSASYTVASTGVADSGALFRCVVSNSAGEVTSAEAQLLVMTPRPPIITADPRDTTVRDGHSAGFAVAAIGNPPLLYQWQRDGLDIPGATAPRYDLSVATRLDSGVTFRCIVSNSIGRDTSRSAVLTVLPMPPSISGQPAAQVVLAGETASFSVRANGTRPLLYQWQKDSIDIPGATDSSYGTPLMSSADSGTVFRCVVLNAAGSTVSAGAYLTVITPRPAEVTVDPQDTTVLDEQPAAFAVSAVGSLPLAYQWQKNDRDVIGATGLAYTLPTVSLADSGTTFRCIVSNSAGTDTSSEALLHVQPAPPVITSQPAARTVVTGNAITFSIAARGTPPLSYQWRRNGSPIPGATDSSYTLTSAASVDNQAAFSCNVSNRRGSVTSQDALLTVTSTPPAVANAVSNGTFENGTTGWILYSNGSATMAASNPGSSGSGYAMQVAVTAVGTNVQLYQHGIALQPNTSYQLSFDAYCSTGHDMEVTVQQHESPHANYGLSFQKFDLSGDWKNCSVTFTTQGASKAVSDARLMFWLAPYDGAGDRFYFDNVQLSKLSDLSPTAPAITAQPSPQVVSVGQTATFSVTASGTPPPTYQWQKNGADVDGAANPSYTTPGTVLADSGALFRCIVSNIAGRDTSLPARLIVITPTASENILTNGTFENGITGWGFYSNGSASYAATSPGASGTGLAMQVSVRAEGSNVQLFQSGITLESNRKYTLSFDAFCSSGHDVTVNLSKHGSPYTNYGLSGRGLDLSTTWQRFSVAFTASGFTGTVSDARLWFWLAPYDAARDSFYFDNVALSRALAKTGPGDDDEQSPVPVKHRTGRGRAPLQLSKPLQSVHGDTLWTAGTSNGHPGGL